jgi:hypothetical protein
MLRLLLALKSDLSASGAPAADDATAVPLTVLLCPAEAAAAVPNLVGAALDVSAKLSLLEVRLARDECRLDVLPALLLLSSCSRSEDLELGLESVERGGDEEAKS